MQSEHKTAAYKAVRTDLGYVFQFFCERSGQLVCITEPYRKESEEAALNAAWRTEGIRHFNRCQKCGRWVNTVMFNPDVLMCVDCAPIEAPPNFCPHCGERVEENAVHCRACGKKLVYEGVIGA